MSDFLRHYVPDSPGEIVNTDGEVLGEHRGLHLYTLGQRRGLGVASNTYREAYVVVAKDPEKNRLVVAFDRPDSPLLYASRCTVEGISFVNRVLGDDEAIHVQPRYRSPAPPARFERTGEDSALIEFEIPQRALTPGQICGLYQGEVLLGGGVFREILYGDG